MILTPVQFKEKYGFLPGENKKILTPEEFQAKYGMLPGSNGKPLTPDEFRAMHSVAPSAQSNTIEAPAAPTEPGKLSSLIKYIPQYMPGLRVPLKKITPETAETNISETQTEPQPEQPDLGYPASPKERFNLYALRSLLAPFKVPGIKDYPEDFQKLPGADKAKLSKVAESINTLRQPEKYLSKPQNAIETASEYAGAMAGDIPYLYASAGWGAKLAKNVPGLTKFDKKLMGSILGGGMYAQFNQPENADLKQKLQHTIDTAAFFAIQDLGIEALGAMYKGISAKLKAGRDLTNDEANAAKQLLEINPQDAEVIGSRMHGEPAEQSGQFIQSEAPQTNKLITKGRMAEMAEREGVLPSSGKPIVTNQTIPEDMVPYVEQARKFGIDPWKPTGELWGKAYLELKIQDVQKQNAEAQRLAELDKKNMEEFNRQNESRQKFIEELKAQREAKEQAQTATPPPQGAVNYAPGAQNTAAPSAQIEIAKKPKAKSKEKEITLFAWIKKAGGVQPASLKEHGFNNKEYKRTFLQIARKNGRGLDDLAVQAVNEGIIPPIPNDANGSDWLMSFITGARKAEVGKAEEQYQWDQHQQDVLDRRYNWAIDLSRKRFPESIPTFDMEGKEAGRLAPGTVVIANEDVMKVQGKSGGKVRLKDGVEITVNPDEVVDVIAEPAEPGMLNDIVLPGSAKKGPKEQIGLFKTQAEMPSGPIGGKAGDRFGATKPVETIEGGLFTPEAPKQGDIFEQDASGQATAAIEKVKPEKVLMNGRLYTRRPDGNYQSGSLTVTPKELGDYHANTEFGRNLIKKAVAEVPKAASGAENLPLTKANIAKFFKWTASRYNEFSKSEAVDQAINILKGQEYSTHWGKAEDFPGKEVRSIEPLGGKPRVEIKVNKRYFTAGSYTPSGSMGGSYYFVDGKEGYIASGYFDDQNNFKEENRQYFNTPATEKPKSSNLFAFSPIGAVAGVEEDEKGKLRYNPIKAMVGMAGGMLLGAAFAGKSSKKWILERMDKYIQQHGIDTIANIAKRNNINLAVMTKAQAIKLIDILKKFDFEKMRGEYLDPNIYAEAIKMGLPKGPPSHFIEDARIAVDKLIMPISARVTKINPALGRKLQKFEYRSMKQTADDCKAVEPLLQATQKMSKNDQIVFDLAQKNGDYSMIRDVCNKYGIWKEYNATRRVVDDLYQREKAVGLDVGYESHYFPRMLADSKGFIQHFSTTEKWDTVLRAIKEQEERLQRYMTIEEKAAFVNSLLRGFNKTKIGLPETGNMKAREIPVIDALMNRFYYSTNESLLRYIRQSNELIEARRFFGIHLKTKMSQAEQELFGLSPEQANMPQTPDYNDSVGAMVLDLAEKMEITTEQENELRSILQARFNAQGMHGFWGLYKNVTYMNTMGSFSSSLRQLGDVAWSLYRGGPIHFAKGITKAIAGKSFIPMRDIGVEQIAHEFMADRKSGKLVNHIFKATGLTTLDMLGKQGYVNTVFSKYFKLAKKPTPEFIERLEKAFGNETNAVIEDLKNRQVTENTKYLAFCEICGIQPISLSEVPEAYLSGGNGRIFYALRTFSIKQFDAFRQECFRDIKTAKTRFARIRAIKRLILLTGALVAVNSGVDYVVNTLFNRDSDMEDLTIDNILRILPGMSKWTLWKMRSEGPVSAFINGILPVAKLPASLVGDAFMVYKKLQKGQTITHQDFDLPANIPLIGKPYYFWFGKGARQTEAKREKLTRLKLKGRGRGRR